MTTKFQIALRELRGLRTQGEFADDLKVSRSAVALWESGRRIPSIAHARTLVARGMDPAVVLTAVLNEGHGDAA